MGESILSHKKLLVVDDESDILNIVSEQIMGCCADTKIDTASNHEDAVELLKSKDYDLVILDIMGVRGFDLLKIAVSRKFKVAMLTSHSLNPEALKKSHDMGAMAYLPKDKLGELVPFLEDVLQNEYKTVWKRIMDKLEAYFNERFEAEWKKKAGTPYWY
jgi:DNA-binding NtrC family response regulator